MVIARGTAANLCQERVTLIVRAQPLLLGDMRPAGGIEPSTLTAGDTCWVIVLLEHDHSVHGRYDLLLGERLVHVMLGSASFRDTITLVADTLPPQPVLQQPLPDRLDTQHGRCGKPSLYVAAHIPGLQYYRFDDMSVPHTTQYRLRFWYYVAMGTRSTCRVRVSEYRDTPTSWKRLEECGFDVCLSGEGSWQFFERSFWTNERTTTLAVDFRLMGSDVGELWISDPKLELVDGRREP